MSTREETAVRCGRSGMFRIACRSMGRSPLTMISLGGVTLLVLSALVLYFSHLIIKARGVRS